MSDNLMDVFAGLAVQHLAEQQQPAGGEEQQQQQQQQNADDAGNAGAASEAAQQAAAAEAAQAQQAAAQQQQQQQQQAATKPDDKATPDIQETLKKTSIAELLKLKGVDEKLVTLYDLYEKTGSLEQYFKAYNTDYDKLDDLEVKKMQIREQYSMLEPDEQEEMVQAALEEYQLDAEQYGDTAARRSKLKLKADVAAYRNTLKERQKESIIAAAAPAGQQQADNRQSEEAAMREYADSVRNSNEFKELSEKGVLKVGSGDAAFNLGMQPQEVFDILTNPDKAISAVTREDGQTNYTKLLLSAAIQHDMDGVIAKLIDHGRNLEKIALAKELGNESVENRRSAGTAGDDDAMLALAGKLQFV